MLEAVEATAAAVAVAEEAANRSLQPLLYLDILGFLLQCFGVVSSLFIYVKGLETFFPLLFVNCKMLERG